MMGRDNGGITGIVQIVPYTSVPMQERNYWSLEQSKAVFARTHSQRFVGPRNSIGRAPSTLVDPGEEGDEAYEDSTLEASICPFVQRSDLARNSEYIR